MGSAASTGGNAIIVVATEPDTETRVQSMEEPKPARNNKRVTFKYPVATNKYLNYRNTTDSKLSEEMKKPLQQHDSKSCVPVKILKNNRLNSSDGNLLASEIWQQYEIEALNAHNHFRYRHAAPPLILSRELCRIAQAHADDLIKRRKFEHSNPSARIHKGCTCGENLAATGAIGRSNYTGYTAVQEWYQKGRMYDFDNPSAEHSGTDSFCQLLWDSTREFGQAFASRKDGIWTHQVAVALYHPAANRPDQRKFSIHRAIYELQ